MTLDEQKQFDRLQDQLSTANRSVDEVRAQFSSALTQANCEARLYRSLFWCLLVMIGAATIVHILQK
jgi:hypothetical protein